MTANLCSFPGCKRVKGKGAYCIQHGRIYGTTTFDKAKPIAKRSDKMKVAIGELKKLAQVYLAKHPNCELKLKGCTGKATCVHHTRGREGKQLLNIEDFMASCSSCNLRAETHDGEARAKGVKKSKHVKNQTN